MVILCFKKITINVIKFYFILKRNHATIYMCLYFTQQKVPICDMLKKEQGQTKFGKSRGISQGLCFLMDLNYNFLTYFICAYVVQAVRLGNSTK